MIAGRTRRRRSRRDLAARAGGSRTVQRIIKMALPTPRTVQMLLNRAARNLLACRHAMARSRPTAQFSEWRSMSALRSVHQR